MFSFFLYEICLCFCSEQQSHFVSLLWTRICTLTTYKSNGCVQYIVVDCSYYSHINWDGFCFFFFAHQPTYFDPFLAFGCVKRRYFVWECIKPFEVKIHQPPEQPTDQPCLHSHFWNDKFSYISTVLFVEHPFGIMLCHSSTKWTAVIRFLMACNKMLFAEWKFMLWLQIVRSLFWQISSKM